MNQKYIKDLVSVVIPTYKRRKTLIRAINSALNQTYNNIEILVVDDNNPGDEFSMFVKALIKSYSDKRVKLLNYSKHKSGGAAAMNAGIRSAQGEFIALLADDDLWCPNKIEIQVKTIRSLDESYGGVSTRILYIKDQKIVRISIGFSNEKQCEKILSRQINISDGTILFKHEMLDETGLYDESLLRHKDIQILSFFTNRYKIFYIDKILTIIDTSDVSNRPTAYRLAEIKKIFFKSVEPILKDYSNRKIKFIKSMHMTEVAWTYYRDGQKLYGLTMLLKYVVQPLVAYSFLKRIWNRYTEKRIAKSYKDKDYIISILKSNTLELLKSDKNKN